MRGRAHISSAENIFRLVSLFNFGRYRSKISETSDRSERGSVFYVHFHNYQVMLPL